MRRADPLVLPGVEHVRVVPAAALEDRRAVDAKGLVGELVALDQLLDGAWSAEAGEARLRGAGFQGGPLAQLTCRAPTVPLCIDQMLTSADGRAALLHPQMRLVGVAAQASTDGVAVALNLASE